MAHAEKAVGQFNADNITTTNNTVTTSTITTGNITNSNLSGADTIFFKNSTETSPTLSGTVASGALTISGGTLWYVQVGATAKAVTVA